MLGNGPKWSEYACGSVCVFTRAFCEGSVGLGGYVCVTFVFLLVLLPSLTDQPIIKPQTVEFLLSNE